jgi:hypothetical protein
MLQLKTSLLLIISATLYLGCQKEYSYEGNAVIATAVFSFYGAPSTCTYANVIGSYKTGTALGVTNVVTIALDVTSTGTYSVSTAVVNGIKFKGTGNFTVTGPQTISLTGSGTPVSAGTFSFSPGANGCSFPVTFENGGTAGSATFTFDGAPGPCTNITVGGKYTIGTALTGSNRVKIDVNVVKTGTYNIKTDVVNGISFSGTGSFTSLGYEVITLIGTGTPIAEGVFIFTPSNNGCPFGVRVTAGVIANDFLKCTIDGAGKTFNTNLLGALIDPTIFSLTGNETSAANTSQFDLAISKSPAVTTGTYNQLSTMNAVIFCIAKYNDGVSATEWTIALSGQTGGFSVNVTGYTANRIEGSFSGTLYSDNGKGNEAKVITNGQFSLPY